MSDTPRTDEAMGKSSWRGTTYEDATYLIELSRQLEREVAELQEALEYVWQNGTDDYWLTTEEGKAWEKKVGDLTLKGKPLKKSLSRV